MGKKRRRHPLRPQFPVVLEVLNVNREAAEIARAHSLDPTTMLGCPRAGGTTGSKGRGAGGEVDHAEGAVARGPERAS